MMSSDKSSDSQGQSEKSEVDELLQKKNFGGALRDAREKAGLSVTSVSETLLISIDVIKALENSQAEFLPPLTFTQGYIRNYARLLGVPADEIIAAYITMAPNSKQVLAPHSVLPVQQSTSNGLVKFINVVLVVFAMIVLFVWLYQTDFSIDQLTGSETSSSQPVLKSFDVKMMESPDEAASLDVEESAQKKIIKNDELVASSEISEPSKASVDSLTLTAMEESWCEVHDADGQRLYYQLLKKNNDIKLLGKAPFNVFLGNAPDVRLEMNGKTVSFDHLISNGKDTVSLKVESDQQKNIIVQNILNR